MAWHARGMYVSSGLVLTPVVPSRPRASVWHPGFRPVETTFRETLRNLRLNYRRASRDRAER